MKLRSVIAVALALAAAPVQAQVNPGSSPLSIVKGGTGGISAASARINLGFAATANRLYGTDGSGVSSVVTLPAAGLTLSGSALSFANDLAALEGLSSTGIARRTGTDAWSVGTAVSNAEHATMAAFTFKGNNTSGSATPTDVDIAALTTKASPAAGDFVMLSDQAASGAWKKATVSSVGSAGSVSSIAGNTGAFTLGTGLTNATNDIRVSLSNLAAALGSNTATNAATYTIGAQTAQGTSGTWMALASVTFVDTAGAQTLKCRITDGTTAYGSGAMTSAAANLVGHMAFSAIVPAPAANIRVECINTAGATTNMLFNQSGNGFDTAIRVFRII